jgi:hypothetical protein
VADELSCDVAATASENEGLSKSKFAVGGLRRKAETADMIGATSRGVFMLFQ